MSETSEVIVKTDPAQESASKHGLVEGTDYKVVTREITRKTEGANGEVTKKARVDFLEALNMAAAQKLCGGELNVALGFLNDGRWAGIRASVSNELASGSPEDRAFSNVAKQLSKLRKISEEEAAQVLRENPAIMQLFSATA